jgi:hypothetical protein
MLAETVQQTNHVLSLPTEPAIKIAKSATKNEPVIIIPEMANAAIYPDTGTSLKHQELITLLRYNIGWMRSTANNIGRLAQGLKYGIKGTTIIFIHKSDVPAERKVTYGYFVVNMKEHKEENERTRLAVGGDQIEYPSDKSTCTAGLATAKIIINITISTKGARFLVIDI